MSTSTRRCLRGASPTKVNHFNPFSEQFQEFRSNPVYFGSVPVLHENCTDIEAGKRKWKDHKLGLASSWGKGCQDVFPLFYSTPSGTKNKSPELNKEGPVGLFNPPLAWREISEVFLSLFFSFFFLLLLVILSSAASCSWGEWSIAEKGLKEEFVNRQLCLLVIWRHFVC